MLNKDIIKTIRTSEDFKKFCSSQGFQVNLYINQDNGRSYEQYYVPSPISMDIGYIDYTHNFEIVLPVDNNIKNFQEYCKSYARRLGFKDLKRNCEDVLPFYPRYCVDDMVVILVCPTDIINCSPLEKTIRGSGYDYCVKLLY